MSTLSPLSPGESIWAVGTEGGSEWEAEGGGREEEAHTQWQESGNHCYIYNNSLPSLSLTAQTEHTDFRDCVNAGKANKGILTKLDRCTVAVSKATATDRGGQVGQFHHSALKSNHQTCIILPLYADLKSSGHHGGEARSVGLLNVTSLCWFQRVTHFILSTMNWHLSNRSSSLARHERFVAEACVGVNIPVWCVLTCLS